MRSFLEMSLAVIHKDEGRESGPQTGRVVVGLLHRRRGQWGCGGWGGGAGWDCPELCQGQEVSRAW